MSHTQTAKRQENHHLQTHGDGLEIQFNHIPEELNLKPERGGKREGKTDSQK